jgi:hypothetical protein
MANHTELKKKIKNIFNELFLIFSKNNLLIILIKIISKILKEFEIFNILNPFFCE